MTGSLSVEPLLLFALIFMWTPPHLWALALFRNEDYTRANVPMLPVVAGEMETRRQILIYAVLLAPLGVAPWFIGMASVLTPVLLALRVRCLSICHYSCSVPVTMRWQGGCLAFHSLSFRSVPGARCRPRHPAVAIRNDIMIERPQPKTAEEMQKMRRSRNFALLGGIVLLVVLFYALTIVRVGSGS